MPDSRPETATDGRALSGEETTIREADGICLEDAIDEAAATTGVTGLLARSREREEGPSTTGSGSSRNSIFFELIGDGRLVDGELAAATGTRFNQAGVGVGPLAAFAAAAA